MEKCKVLFKNVFSLYLTKFLEIKISLHTITMLQVKLKYKCKIK